MPHVDHKGPDGSRWPSATELTHLLPQAWVWSWYKDSVKKHGWRGWQKNLATSNRGKRVGTDTHTLLEHLIKQQPLPLVDKRALPLAEALFDKTSSICGQIVGLEQHLISNEMRVAGTADLITYRSDMEGLWIGDWKTSYIKDELCHPIQLAIYALAWNESHPDAQIDNGFIMRVNKKSKKNHVLVDNYTQLHLYKPVITALRTVWEYSEKEGPWDKGEGF